MKKYSDYLVLNEAKSATSLSSIYEKLVNKAILEYFIYLRSEFKMMGIDTSISTFNHAGNMKNEEYIKNWGWIDLKTYKNDKGSTIESFESLKNIDKRNLFLKCNYADYTFYIGFLNIEGTKFKIFTYRTEISPNDVGPNAGEIGKQVFLLNNEIFWKITDFEDINKFKEAFEKAVKNGWIDHEKKLEENAKGRMSAKKTGIV